MHRFSVLSMNKTEMSWTSLRGIAMRRGKFALKPLLRNTQEKWHLCVKIQYNVFINIYLWDDGTFISKLRLPFLTVSRLTFVFESQTIRLVQLRFPRFKPSGEEKKGISTKFYNIKWLVRYVWDTLFSRVLFITKAVFCGEQRSLSPWGRQRGKYSSFFDLFSFRYHYLRKAQRLNSYLTVAFQG